MENRFRRKNILLCFMVAIICFANTNFVIAQKEYKTIHKETYVFDNGKNVVYNKALESKSSASKSSEGFFVKNPTIVASTFKSVLSKDRLKELSADNIVVIFNCTKDGEISSMKFVFAKKPFLSVEEIEKLEKAFMKECFSISASEETASEIKFAIPCFFGRLID